LKGRRKHRSIRVIAGALRGRRIATPEGRETRPPLDSQRETIFNILGPAVSGAMVVDLFCGSGSFGIEALSRGAGKAWFLERNAAALQALTTNLSDLGLEEVSRILRCDAFQFPDVPGGWSDPADLVFIDPPFKVLAAPEGGMLVQRLLDRVGPAMAGGGVVVLRLSSHSPQPRLPRGCKDENPRALGKSRVHFLTY